MSVSPSIDSASVPSQANRLEVQPCKKRVHRGTRGTRRKQQRKASQTADCPPWSEHEVSTKTDVPLVKSSFQVECLQQTVRSSAFKVLAYDFGPDYDYTVADLRRWEAPRPKTSPSSDEDPYRDWPLDIPDVPCIEVDAVELLARGTPHELAVTNAVSLITRPQAYDALRLSGGNGPSGDRPVGPRQSFGFARFREELIRKDFLRPISRRRIRKFVLGFTVPKSKKKTLRTVLDGRPQNAEQDRPPHVDLASLSDILQATNDFPLCREFDAIGFFHQFRMHPDIAANWVLKIGKERFAWTRMPMGWSHAVFVAHTVAQLLADVKVEGVRTLVYIDNIYFFGISAQAIELATRIFLERCATVNATFEISTDITDVLTVLGIRCDLQRKQVSMPASFIAKFENVLDLLPELFLTGEKEEPKNLPTTRLLWKVLGSLMWAARVLGVAMHPYGNLLAWLSRRAGQLTADLTLWEKPCAIWPAALQDLRSLIKRVILNVPRPVFSFKHGPHERVHELYSDASDTGHATVHCGEILQGPIQCLWDSVLKGKIIAERELFALVEGVRQAKHALPDLALIRAYNDNTNVISWVTKRRGKSVYANILLSRLFELLGETQLDILYVPSSQNLADKPSRFF